jgi:subtilisin family serine protease
MKKLIILLSFSSLVFAQTPAVVQQDLMNFEPGELIVKLKDDVDAGVYYEANGKAMSNFNIGELLGIEEKVASSKVMFHQSSIESSIQNQKRLAAQYAAQAAANPNNGYQPEPPRSMKNVFVITTTNEQENIPILVEELKNNPNVDYAEPNYIYGIDDFEVGEIITAEEASKMTASNSSSTIEVDDPLYSSQSNITATNIDDVWDQYTTGDGSQVIAILDTGVDYTHPDLEANIWINEAELNGVEGYDDDGNGYVDDIRGWDFINIDNAPLDDNMHGTHVAGIAGAVGNNGIGIAGAAWDVKLMPIKVFQSSGVGNSTNIASGVEYASTNGATIINMSFGSYAESSTLKLALENAYATSILVGAAGNNGICLGPGLGCAPFYPGSYNYILGVQDRPLPVPYDTGYTNFDNDGPISTEYGNLLNYELFAPGTGIMSTIPNGGYATLTGTSMATPLVSGGLALYYVQKPDDSKELMFGNLINTSSNYVNFNNAIEISPVPSLKVLTASLDDSSNDQNSNGLWEPNEIIEIFPLVKNYWGATEDVRVGIEFAEFEDTSKATIIQNEIQIGSMSAYSTLVDLEHSLKIILSDDLVDGVDIKFNLISYVGDDEEYSSSTELVVNVTNGNLITGHYVDEVLILEENNYYIVSGVCVLENTKVIIEQGVTLEFDSNMTFMTIGSSHWEANGVNNNRITIKSSDGLSNPKIPLGSQYPPSFYFQYYKLDIEDPMSGYNYSLNNENSLNGTGNYPRALSSYNYCDFIGVDTTWISGSNSSPTALFKNCNFKGDNIIYNGFIYKSTIENPGSFPGNENNWNNVISGGAFGNCYGCIDVNDQDSNTIPFNTFNNFVGILPSYLTNTGSGNGGKQYGNNNIIKYANNNSNLKIYDIGGMGAKIINQTFGDANSSPPTLSPFMGPSTIEMFQEISVDIFNGGSTGIFDWDNSAVALTPYEEAHAFVWKVDINGINSFDNYNILDPIGVGTHEFKVYFNREMDTSVDPIISYGVTIRNKQTTINEEGFWSEDGKIYTVNHEIKIGSADGINRIKVQNAQDLDFFKIPTEQYRFNMLIQSAGSASTGFLAQGGLGKIDLEWVAPSADELDDVLGYNMYRYQIDEDGNESEPEKLNETLIIEDTDESTTGVYFTDYDVVEGQTYFYKYKILRTSFEETDYSNTVSSAPLTSTLGDSNGDFDVNVLDLVHDVDYVLGNNPEPFIFVAGDVNADNTINVLDIVGTVDIILNGDGGDVGGNSMDINFYPSEPIGYADFSWEGNDLYVESMHSIGGLQLAFDADFEYVLHDLPGVERLDYTQDESKVLMLYSFNNTAIASTRTKLLTRLDSTKEIDIDLAVAGTTTGAKLTPRFKGGELDGIDSPFQSNGLEFLKLFPNPSNGDITLEYYLPKNMDGAVAKVYDMVGRLVWIQAIEREEGMQQADLNLNSLQKGNYVVIISAGNNSGEQLINHKLLILK